MGGVRVWRSSYGGSKGVEVFLWGCGGLPMGVWRSSYGGSKGVEVFLCFHLMVMKIVQCFINGNDVIVIMSYM